tara:strand:+ start:1490 stop:2182 length:693 start_codon:yes stop_codon:yes gene_type:complete
MKKCIEQRVAVALLVFAASNATWALTIEEMKVDWGNSYILAGSGGLENPLLRVAFNPQPEPPAAGVLSYGRPMEEGYPPDPIITNTGDFTEGALFRVLFGISGESGLMIPGEGVAGGPNGSLLDFNVFNDSGAVAFAVQLELTTSSGGNSINWVAFNPQPEPPALGDGAASFGADLSFDSFSDVSMAVRVFDSQGAPITLTQVPLPAPIVLLGLGLMQLAWSRRTVPRKS